MHSGNNVGTGQEVRDKSKIKGQLINTWIGMNVSNLEEWEKKCKKGYQDQTL